MSFVWENIIRPVLFSLDAERAHEIGIKALAGVAAEFLRAAPVQLPLLQTNVFGLEFSNPLGLAAGFDKNGIAVDPLADLGFGFVEAGTVTLRPQPGNPKPRLFRIPSANALVNRLGFNNHGADAAADRISQAARRCVIGINIGKNKDVPNEEAIENYVACFEAVHSAADYIAVNVSSPNTPNLRELQHSESLSNLLGALQRRNSDLGSKPLLVKIAPDLDDGQIREIADIALEKSISGIIATNTTIARPGVSEADIERVGAGGLSGRPLAKMATDIISVIYRHTEGRLPIIGVGGIFDAADAFEKVAAGAVLVQAYTGFIYGGPGFANELTRGLSRILEEKGFASISEAVGSAVSGQVSGLTIGSQRL